MNFTWDSLTASQTALNRLREEFSALEGEGEKLLSYSERFKEALSDDLNTSQALAILWELIKSGENPSSKKSTLLSFDEILGLNIASYKPAEITIPKDVELLLEKREEVREKGDFEEGDRI